MLLVFEAKPMTRHLLGVFWRRLSSHTDISLVFLQLYKDVCPESLACTNRQTITGIENTVVLKDSVSGHI